jgi:hypothetical protein
MSFGLCTLIWDWFGCTLVWIALVWDCTSFRIFSATLVVHAFGFGNWDIGKGKDNKTKENKKKKISVRGGVWIRCVYMRLGFLVRFVFWFMVWLGFCIRWNGILDR